jgi:hypothetical protein
MIICEYKSFTKDVPTPVERFFMAVAGDFLCCQCKWKIIKLFRVFMFNICYCLLFSMCFNDWAYIENSLSLVVRVDIYIYSKCKLQSNDSRKVWWSICWDIHRLYKKFIRFSYYLSCYHVEVEHFSFICFICCIES